MKINELIEIEMNELNGLIELGMNELIVNEMLREDSILFGIILQEYKGTGRELMEKNYEKIIWENESNTYIRAHTSIMNKKNQELKQKTNKNYLFKVVKIRELEFAPEVRTSCYG